MEGLLEKWGPARWQRPRGKLTGFIPFFFFFSSPPTPRPPLLSPFIASLPFLSGLFGFDSGQMVKLCEPDREFY